MCEDLNAFQTGQVQASNSVIKADENLRIGFYRREPASGFVSGKEDCFTLMGCMDFDTKTFPGADVPEVLAIALPEKTAKRMKALLKYPSLQSYSKWWLVLVDYIAAGSQRSITMKHDWDKVIIIFPREYERAYEILNSN